MEAISINVASIVEKDDHQIVTLVDAEHENRELIHMIDNPSNYQENLGINLGPHCLICNAKLGVSGRGSMHLFSKQVKTSARHLDLDCVLGNILNRQLQETNTHSTIICKKCFKLIDDFDAVEEKLVALKEEVNHKFLKTEDLVQNSPIVEPMKTNEINEESNFKSYSRSSKRLKRSKKGKSKKENFMPNVLKFEVKEEESDDLLTCFNFQETSGFEDSINTVVEEDDEFSSTEILIDDIENIIEVDGLDIDSSEDTIQIADIVLPTVSHEMIANEYQDEEISDIFNEKATVKYQCRFCQERTNTFSSMKEHLFEIHQERLYECEVCKDQCENRNHLLQHLEEHVLSGIKLFRCELCQNQFSLNRQLREHFKYHSSKTIACYKCPKKFRTENALQQHLNQHTGRKPFACDKCFKRFTTKTVLNAHKKIHGVRARPHKCPHCDKSFLTHHHLTDHIQIHDTDRGCQCDVCGKSFCSSRSLELHAIIHTGVKNFVCKHCKKAFARKGEIDDHERTHTGERPFQCELCGAQFSQRSNLQTHKRSTHFKEKRYECNQCNKAFKRRRLLVYHTMSVHTGERPYKCDICTASFVYPEHFKKHLRIHSGVKPFKCEICGKAFNSRDNKNAHKFIHSDKKQYECTICGSGFMRKPQLVAHISQHGQLDDVESFIKFNNASVVDKELNTGLYSPSSRLEIVRNPSNEHHDASVQLLNHQTGPPMIIEDDDMHQYMIPNSQEVVAIRNNEIELTANQIKEIAEAAAAQVAANATSTGLVVSTSGQHNAIIKNTNTIGSSSQTTTTLNGAGYLIQLQFDNEDSSNKVDTAEQEDHHVTKSTSSTGEIRQLQILQTPNSYKKMQPRIRTWQH